MFDKTVHWLRIDLSMVDYQHGRSKARAARESEGTYCIARVHMYTYYLHVCTLAKSRDFCTQNQDAEILYHIPG